MEREAPEPTGNGLVRNLHRYLRDDRDAEEGLEYKGSNGVETAVVKGDYDFYHFGHEVNDMGWGCAYRSFQTLCSWFVLQRHPNFVTASASGKEQALVAVPSHKKVQETLFRIGDKPIHFIGSREWIGSYELCLCFDAMFNIKCKILYLASGKEVAGKYDLFRQHFLTHGCPIMIGGKSGGALTLLGVRRWNDEDSTNGNTTDNNNNNNNKMEMLLLDPHYVGPDKPASILASSQWCYWREPEQVFADSFYNFLLPQAATENTQ